MAPYTSPMATGAFSGEPSSLSTALRSYRVELPQELLEADERLIDWVLDFAFETLDARHLELRIIAETCSDLYQRQGV